jgi:glycosyltransferase involved in cell wall biosynthesis
MDIMPKISVIVATYNRASSLRETLAALAAQTLPVSEYEIIVVDDGSTDDTSDCVAKFASENPSLNLRYERHSVNRWKAAACNTGIRMAKSELIAFIDDDIRPVPGWLESHLRRHEKENRDVSITGPVAYPEEWVRRSNWVRFTNDNYRRSDFRYIDGQNLAPSRFAGGNTSLRRETLMKVGLFDETSIRMEDGIMGCQLHEAGVPLLFEPNALVYHYADAIQSIDATLRSFRRSYELDRENVIKRFPWAYEKYCHWYFEPFNPDFDTSWRRMVKCMVRIVTRRYLQRIAVRFVRLIDRHPRLYWRPLYQYVFACEAMDGIRAARKVSAKKPNV